MRKLVWTAIGVTAACAIGAYLLNGYWLLILGAVCLCGCLAAVCIRTPAGRKAALVLMGAAAAFVWFFAFDWIVLTGIRAMDGLAVETAVEITDYSYATDYGVAADGKINLNGKTYQVRIYLYDSAALSPGDRVDGTLRLRYTPRGGLDEMTHHQGKGIFLLGYFRDDAVVTKADSVPGKYFAAALRQNIKGILEDVFPGDTLAFVRALLLGDDSLLTYRDSTNLSVSGIRHIIAVSGLHVSILFSIVFFFFGYHRVLTPLIGIPLLVAFAALTGFTPSVVRACIMQGLMLLSLMVDKEYDAPTALAFSVLVMLAVNPLTVTSVSFQLSVGCMVGILGLSGKICDYFLDEKRFGPAKGKSLKARTIRWFFGSVSVTVGAMAVTTPLCACYFGMVSLVGILTNLLCLWAVTFLFCGVLAACAVGVLWLPLGKTIGWIVSWLARYILFVSETLASIPFAAVYTCSTYVVTWLIMTYVLVIVFVCVKRKKPGLLAVCILTGLCISLGCSCLEPKLDRYRMTVLDVGQGQCILLQNEGRHYLVDCGGDSAPGAADQAAQLLLSQGVTRLDGVILTHYDTDHAGGVEAILSRISADTLYLPNVKDVGFIRESIENGSTAHIQWIEPEQTLTIEEGDITLFAGKEGVSDNESGLCVLFQPENCDILITGDRSAPGERALLAQTQLPDLEVLVVGHHGSKTSTCLELLHTTRPEIAVISVGADNKYGHPAAELLSRLERFDCQILRTDILGNIIIRG